ncbi:MAG: hypothetical protein WBW03_17365, partial [Silvibacterium sp.]
LYIDAGGISTAKFPSELHLGLPGVVVTHETSHEPDDDQPPRGESVRAAALVTAAPSYELRWVASAGTTL